MGDSRKNEKGFFKVFRPEKSSHGLKIPTAFTKYHNGKLPEKVWLRDRYGNIWPMGLAKTGGNLYFQDGWKRFIEDNAVESENIFIFDYNGNDLFDFKLFGETACEKKGVGDLGFVEVEEEEKLNEHPKSEEEDDEQEEEEAVYEVEEETEEEAEEIKMTPHSQGCKRARAFKGKDPPDHYGADLFKSGRVTQPENPYFVTKIRKNRRNLLYIPVDIVKDYNFELPQRMVLRDPVGREVDAQLKIWGDGRIWLKGGWHTLCRTNRVEKEDKCICEFMRGNGKKSVYIQVHVVRQGSASHHS